MKRARVPETRRFTSNVPATCQRQVVDEEQSVLVKVGLKKPETRLCGRQLVRWRRVMVCPSCTELVDSVKRLPDGDLDVNRVPLEQVFVNRRARRAS